MAFTKQEIETQKYKYIAYIIIQTKCNTSMLILHYETYYMTLYFKMA
jgi:hypothetical protein